MKVQEVKAALHERLGEGFLQAGFKFRKGAFEYVCKGGELTHIFRIYVHAMTEWYLVKPAVFIGCPRINDWMNQAKLNGVGTFDDVTTGFGVRDRHRERGSYSIKQAEDIEAAAVKIEADFKEIAVAFYAGMAGISDLEKYMNAKSEEGKYRPMSVSYACAGLVAAKFCHNAEFEVIARDYYEFCKRAQGEKLAEPIRQTERLLMENEGGGGKSLMVV